MSQATLYRWMAQDRIDRDERPGLIEQRAGLTSSERVELGPTLSHSSQEFEDLGTPASPLS